MFDHTEELLAVGKELFPNAPRETLMRGLTELRKEHSDKTLLEWSKNKIITKTFVRMLAKKRFENLRGK